ncbi:BatD family protein [bacterium]|nr:BatD family protein [bacterium]
MFIKRNKTLGMIERTIWLLWIFSFFNQVGAADDLNVKSYIDRSVIGLNQQFILSVEISGGGANSAPNPEIPPMDDFATLLGSGSSQNIQLLNSVMSISKTINYYFQATAIGKYTIDPVTVTWNGKTYSTDPIAIEIQQASKPLQSTPKQDAPVEETGLAESDLFLKAIVNKKQVYQNEPVVVTYKIYTIVNISEVGLAKTPSTGGFWIEEFPLDRQLQTSTEIVGGKQYTVATIKKMALFPMSSGIKTIDPLAVDCEVSVRQSSGNLFDDFFNDPFFSRTVQKRIQSETVTVNVLPLPEEGKPADFSGVVGKFIISGWVDKTNVETNEAVSYQIKIEGDGNIQALPEPDVSFPADFEIYPPKVAEYIDRTGSIVSGNKTYEFVFVPRAAGVQKIKPVQFHYFDPTEKKYNTIQTKEIVIQVVRGKDMITTVSSGLTKEEVQLLGQDIRFIKTEISSIRKIGYLFYEQMYFWIIMVFPLFGLIGALVYRRHINRLQGDRAYARERRANRLAKKRLSTTKSLLKPSTQKAFYAEMGRALMGYLGDKLNIDEAGMMTDDVRKLLNKKGVEEKDVELIFDCIRICDMRCFSPSDLDEDEMKVFFQKVQLAIRHVDKRLSK